MKLVRQLSAIGLSIGAVAICVITYRYLRKGKDSRPARKWHQIGTLQEITLYPIKSASAVVLEEANCDSYGLFKHYFHDRRLVLLHEVDKKIVSVSRYPFMLSIKMKIISPGVLVLKAPNIEPLTLNINEFTAHDGQRFIQQMNGYSLELIEGLPEHHEWFSSVLLHRRLGLRLYLALDPIIETRWWRKVPNDYKPIMVIHNKSVNDLNLILSPTNQVHRHQFRGNLYIKSSEKVPAFDEDNWLWLKIGDNRRKTTILRFNSPCERCIITNINVATCKRNEDFEPLSTLRRLRLRGHPTDPEMGVYFDVYKEGRLRCGDPVYAQYK